MWGLCSALPVKSDVLSPTAQMLFVIEAGNNILMPCPEDAPAGNPMDAGPAAVASIGLGNWFALCICTLRMPVLGCTLLPGWGLVPGCGALGAAATWKPDVLPLLAVPLALP